MHIYTYIVNRQNYNSWYIQQTFTFIKFEKNVGENIDLMWLFYPLLPVNNEFSGFIKTV